MSYALIFTPLIDHHILALLCQSQNLLVATLPNVTGAVALVEIPEDKLEITDSDWDLLEGKEDPALFNFDIPDDLEGAFGGKEPNLENVEAVAGPLSHLLQGGVVVMWANLTYDSATEEGVSGQVVAYRYKQGKRVAEAKNMRASEFAGQLAAISDDWVEQVLFEEEKPENIPGYFTASALSAAQALDELTRQAHQNNAKLEEEASRNNPQSYGQ